jgi:signal transduction histidine kinase
MKSHERTGIEVNIPEFLAGGGEMGERIRSFDWTATPLGHPHTWPPSLRTCVRIMLASRQPIWLGWGKQLIKLYNDPYRSIVGGKHPEALGQPASVVWKDIWREIEPLLELVMEKDQGTYVESQLLIMHRNGYPEETYYTFSYTPVPGEDGRPAGMICFNTDDTARITGERQLKTLRDLSQSFINCKEKQDVYQRTITALQQNTYDFPFALLYELSPDHAHLVAATEDDHAAFNIPVHIDLKEDNELSQHCLAAIRTDSQQVMEGLIAKLGNMPKGAWEIAPEKALILPIAQSGQSKTYGLFVIGLNPYRLPDERYQSFFTLVADQVATALSDVFALEAERKRAEALAEIDRAKTAFFTNISHEFRTPLTLMLGSLEELLDKPVVELGRDNKEIVDTTHRNAMRLLRLVNNLLDFSRIEAGKTKAQYRLTDISRYTIDLASTFRSVIEAAGLQLNVYSERIDAPVYVDQQMWEKIVLNLLSNAFKYTMRGHITVSLQQHDGNVVLKVADTGVGIPESELPKMFQRFHRVENVTGRTYEGSGIGLSLVKELVHLHEGNITVTSRQGKGSEFTITIPTGKAHLPANQVSDKETDAAVTLDNSFIEEAATLIDLSLSENSKTAADGEKPAIMVVDDNADMRSYFTSLLQKQYTVFTADNGLQAVGILKERTPQLIISDVMMPVMNGIELLQTVKNDEQLSNIPVILVSARAGEEAKIEGYDIGADDYLVKPFSAKELLARVKAQVIIAEKRKKIAESEKKYRSIAEQLEALVKERTEDLNRTNLELQRSNDDLQQFAHVASHDLKEPVRKVRIFSNLLETELQGNITYKAKTFLSKIEAAAARMYAMIEGVLLYSSLDATRMVHEQVSLAEVIEQTKSDLEIVIAQKHAVIDYGELPVVSGSRVLLERLFYNLINNALKFSHPSRNLSIDITVSVLDSAKLEDSLNLVAEGQYYEIVVRDNGIGFDPAEAEKIFKTFTRLHTKDKYEGTGLGLALCKKIVELHSGAIQARSVEGQGSSFIVLLPVKTQ